MPQTLILDSSQISTNLECPQKHLYEYEQNLVQIDPLTGNAPDVSDKIRAGTLGHKYLEIFYETLALTQDAQLAARTALDFDLESFPNHESEFPSDPTLRAKVKDRFGDYLMYYGGRDYEVANGSTTQIGIDENGMLCDVVAPRPLVEQGFSFKLLDTPEYLFVLEGRVDFIGSANGELFFMDHKWQFKESELYAKSVQFRNYALATGLCLGVVNYIRLHDKIGPKTFVRQPLCFSAADSTHWRKELTDIYVHIAKQRAAGIRFKNRFACAGKFGQHCQYISLCDSLSFEERDFLIRSRFAQRAPWHPWKKGEL